MSILCLTLVRPYDFALCLSGNGASTVLLDPTDIAALDEQPVALRDIKIDTEAEAKRPELKRQAQEWAGIKQDPEADLFVFVGRWSKQKGVDLIADIMPSM